VTSVKPQLRDHDSIMTKKRQQRKKKVARRTKDRPAMAQETVITLTPEAQLALWNALQQSPELTDAQRRLGVMMRGGRNKGAE